MIKKSNLLIALYITVLIISTLLARRLNTFEDRFIDIFFLFLISIPFGKNNRNFYLIYLIIFFMSVACLLQFKNNENLNLLIIVINGILSFVSIYLGIKKLHSTEYK